MNPDINKGLDVIWTSDNIAIIVLMVCLIFSLFANMWQYRSINAIKDVLQTIAVTIAVLNERLNRHE